MKKIYVACLIVVVVTSILFYKQGKQSRIDAYHDLHVTQYEEQLDTVLSELQKLKEAVTTEAPDTLKYLIQSRGELERLALAIERFKAENSYSSFISLTRLFPEYHQSILDDQYYYTPEAEVIDKMIQDFTTLKEGRIFDTKPGDYETIRARWKSVKEQLLLHPKPDTWSL
ncbi:hypothetical protein ACR6HW_09170 [Fusibacter sp. JL298sf-3]